MKTALFTGKSLIRNIQGYFTEPKKYANLIFWCVFLFLFLIFGTRHLLDSDEGVILNGAWHIYSGKRLYLDIFEYIPPAGFYIVYFAWKIFGVSYWSAKLTGLLALAAALAGINKISGYYLNNLWRYIPGLLYVISALSWSLINHNIYNIAFVVWSIYYFLKGLATRKMHDFALSGLLAAFAVLTLQQKGLVLILALASYLLINVFIRKTLKLSPLICFLAASIIPILLLATFWPASLLYQVLVVYPLIFYPGNNMVNFGLLLFFLIILILYVFLLEKNKRAAEPLIWIQFFLLAQTIPRADSFHLLLVIFPLHILTALTAENFANLKLHAKMQVAGFTSIIICLIIAYNVLSFVQFPPFSSLTGSRAFNAVLNECAAARNIYAGPFLPGLYFEARKTNALPYSQVHLLSERQLAEAAVIIATARPECAAMNYDLVKKFNYRKNAIDNFIQSNYTLVYKEGSFELYKLDSSL